MEGVPQDFVALIAHPHPMDLPGLKAHWRRSRHTLQVGGVFKPVGVAADFSQQPRREGLGRSRQGAKEVAVGMLVKKGLDLLAVLVELVLHRAQHPGQADGQKAFGGGYGGGAAEAVCPLEYLHPFGGGVRPPKFLCVQEIFPAPASGLGQSVRCREPDDKIPAERFGPVVKSFQSGWKIFAESLLQLVDQGGALLDQADFIAAQELDLLGQGIQRLEDFPLLAFQAQSIGQGPRVQTICLVFRWALCAPGSSWRCAD
jgi:hypothetical protein